MSLERRTSVDSIENVRTCLKEHSSLMKADDLCKRLSNIPPDRIRTLLGIHGEFVRNSKGECFHADLFSVTDEDILVESGVTLQKKEVLNYLSSNGYIARRTYAGIEALMIKARAKRNKKEK